MIYGAVVWCEPVCCGLWAEFLNCAPTRLQATSLDSDSAAARQGAKQSRGKAKQAAEARGMCVLDIKKRQMTEGRKSRPDLIHRSPFPRTRLNSLATRRT